MAELKWEHLDIAASIWTLPKQETKSDRRHEVPLSPLAIDIVERLPREGAYVFSTTGTTPVSGFSKAKVRLDTLLDIADWRLHDLRRTAASGMAEIGIQPHVIEKVLNHSNGQVSGVAAVYNRHAYRQEKVHALCAWGRALETIVGNSSENVIDIGGGHHAKQER